VKTLADPECKAEILRRLKSVRPDSPRQWGRMSAHQMLCHLADAFRMAFGEKAVSDTSRPVKRTVLKWIALYGPLPFPPDFPTRPEIDQQCGGTTPGEFAADLAQLEALVERFASRAARDEWPRHPIFGRMSHRAWMRWAYLHFDHHLRQFGA